MDTFLSIIIPVYNIEEKYLRKCFESIISQDDNHFLVYIVDDGSSNGAEIICDEYGKKDGRFIVIHQANGGVSSARNIGISESSTTWITFVDPDDWIETNHVSTIRKAIENYKADIYLFDYWQEFAKKTVEKHLPNKRGYLSNEWVDALSISPFNQLVFNGKAIEYETNVIWNKVYRSDLIKDRNIQFNLEAKKGQDVIFNAEVLQLTRSYYYINEALYHYRYLQVSITNRYNPKAVYYNEIAFSEYERIIYQYNLPKRYWEAFYARVVTRCYSTMRLYYFHPENKKSYSEVNDELLSMIDRYPYSEALDNVTSDNLSNSQKIFTYFLKRRNVFVLRLLVKGRKILKELKGAKLK